MIGRIVLGFLGVAFIGDGLADMRMSDLATQTASFVATQVGQIDPQKTPYIEISDLDPVVSWCFYNVLEHEPDSAKTAMGTYAPILVSTRNKKDARRASLVASAVIVLKKCNKDMTPIDLPQIVRGIAYRGLSRLPDSLPEEFSKQKISLPSDVLVLEQRDDPPTKSSAIEKIAGGIFLLGIAIIPFFPRRKKYDEKLLSSGDLARAAGELRPLLSHSSRLLDLITEPLSPSTEKTEEILLLRVNCNVDRIPSLLVLTNRRLMIFRTGSKFWPMLGRTIGRILDKGAERVPGGAFLMLGIEPFFETYEVLFVREEKKWRENLGFDDSEILEGHTPWRKISELTLSEIPEVFISIKAWKDWLLNSATIRFDLHSKQKRRWKTKELEITDFVFLIVVRRFLADAQAALSSAGFSVRADEKKHFLELYPPSVTAREIAAAS